MTKPYIEITANILSSTAGDTLLELLCGKASTFPFSEKKSLSIEYILKNA